MLYLFGISKKRAFQMCMDWGMLGDHIFSEIEGASWMLLGFWAVAECTSHQLGFGRESGIVPTNRHYNKKHGRCNDVF